MTTKPLTRDEIEARLMAGGLAAPKDEMLVRTLDLIAECDALKAELTAERLAHEQTRAERDLLLKDPANRLDGYRELGARLATITEHFEEAARERDEQRSLKYEETRKVVALQEQLATAVAANLNHFPLAGDLESVRRVIFDTTKKAIWAGFDGPNEQSEYDVLRQQITNLKNLAESKRADLEKLRAAAREVLDSFDFNSAALPTPESYEAFVKLAALLTEGT